MFEFLPTKDIRNFDVKKIIGKFAHINCREISEDKKRQWIIVEMKEFDIHASTWVDILGKKDEKLKRKVIDAYFAAYDSIFGNH